MKRLLLGGIGVLLVAVLTLITNGAKKSSNVLLIVIDTLRVDHLGFSGYERDTSPNLDKFAKDNLEFPNAIASSSWTPPAVASIFTGLYATAHGHMEVIKQEIGEKGEKVTKVGKLAERFVTLAEVFQSSGYATAAIVGNPVISKSQGFAQGFDRFYSSVRMEGAQQIGSLAIESLKSLHRENSPFFLYLHFIDPHHPYESPTQYQSLFLDRLKSPRFSKYDQADLEKIDRYDRAVMFVDNAIGSVFQYLKSENLYDEMVIAVVADHGEQFNERGHWGHGYRLFREEIRVPLLLKAQDQKGKNELFVSQVDIFSTLLDAASVQDQIPNHGFSLLSDAQSRAETPIISEILKSFNQKAFINQKGMKLIANYPRERGLVVTNNLHDGKLFKLYDIKSDTYEELQLDNQDRIAKLRLQFYSFYDDIQKLRTSNEAEEIEEKEETIEQLKSLGYL